MYRFTDLTPLIHTPQNTESGGQKVRMVQLKEKKAADLANLRPGNNYTTSNVFLGGLWQWHVLFFWSGQWHVLYVMTYDLWLMSCFLKIKIKYIIWVLKKHLCKIFLFILEWKRNFSILPTLFLNHHTSYYLFYIIFH